MPDMEFGAAKEVAPRSHRLFVIPAQAGIDSVT
ncbi:hypothetical protein NOVOSPHI9U_10340 [Novosphingobium sp. 9U]|nr:hypothetical protein NOVOSPHI9U_10340 [Novosphingobium sp. 9U]